MRQIKQYGFTLIELSLVMAIITGLLTIAVPDMFKLRLSSERRECTAAIYGLIQHAKSLAVATNRPLWLHIRNESLGQQWRLSLTNTDNIPSTSNTVSVIDAISFPNIVLDGAYLNDKLMFFPERGKLSSGHIKIALRSQPGSHLKLITSFGAARIRICSNGIRYDDWPKC
ncbi:GspH/FimT family pseudopilin [Vibrio viridaestus]|uniref:Type II secretion system protein H n=1 Tax=Vibrio viridaestus TaxID=2487322 RepID=A0A3N9TGA0_9VIBR|nr:GspH/FimT family pseudopilin [Vibrio viridaestus]RQW62505.1 prepilin-type N-terminal cleavage/methylation domain-containing protein [Vibrio viridaestus]